MKVSEFKGIANNLCSNLDNQFLFGSYKDLKPPIELNVLKDKSELAQHCWSFIKERIRAPFDLERIKEVILKVHRKEKFQTVMVKIKIDNKEIVGRAASL
jgi:hypothetical protein